MKDIWTIKQIYDYVENIDFEETEEKDGRYECEVSNIYDVSRKIYFIKMKGLHLAEVDDTDIVDRIVNKGPKEIVGKSKEFLEARL